MVYIYNGNPMEKKYFKSKKKGHGRSKCKGVQNVKVCKVITSTSYTWGAAITG